MNHLPDLTSKVQAIWVMSIHKWIRCLIVFFAFMLYSPILMYSQNGAVRNQIEREIENATEEIDSDESDSSLEEVLELIEELVRQPLNINRASADDLMQIPGISFRVATNIVNYRSAHAPFTSIDQLTRVQGIGTATLERIRPYMTIGTARESGRDIYLNHRFWTNNGRFEGIMRYQQVLQQQEGYKRPDSLGGFLGSPVKYYQRFRYSSNQVSLNFTQVKEPGEKLPGPADFDFQSWHIAIRDVGRIQQFIIGDYHVTFGQGLILWSSGAFGKGRDVTQGIAKNERGVRPFTSAQQSNGFRGVAASWGERVQVTGFYSNRKRTASEAENGRVNFPADHGLHRTINEISRRNNLNQETFGGRIRAKLPPGFIGISAFHNRFDREIASGSQPYQKHSFSGNDLFGYSFDYRLLTGNITHFGELAYTGSGGYGLLAGSRFQIGREADIVIAYRRYDERLHSIFGSAFAEQSGRPRNEQGFYLGFRHSITDAIRISGYFDHFRYPAPRFQTNRPTSGYDWLGLIEYNPSRNADLYALVRYKVREQEYSWKDDYGRDVRLLDDEKRTGIRMHAGYQVHPRVRLRTRFDLVRARTAVSEPVWGYLVFQDIRFLLRPDLRIDARITMFDTDGFQSRVFQFESDLLYVLANVMLFDQGQRMYLVLHYRAADWLEFWMKAATTVYENKNVIGSGLSQIQGHRKSDIGMQVRVRF